MKASTINQLSDKSIIQAISDKNELAFASFYNHHWDSLFISAYKVLKDEEACKDVVQEVFLSIWGNEQLQDIKNIEGYLHQSVRYKVLMALRKAKVSEKHLETVTEVAENTTENLLAYEELNDTVERSIGSLPERCQEVFRMSRMENLSNKEIAERLDISVRTVETHIGNALRKLKNALDSQVVYVIFALLQSAVMITTLTQYYINLICHFALRSCPNQRNIHVKAINDKARISRSSRPLLDR